MPQTLQEKTLITKVRVQRNNTSEFVDWQTKLNTCISSFPGFVSLEILSSNQDTNPSWTIVQRFSNANNALGWKESNKHQQLFQELERFVGSEAIQEQESNTSDLKEGVTEVFVTQVNPEKEEAFRQWIAKIHQVEANFPGFRGMYVQAPKQKEGHHWLTFLHFDTTQNLDRWLESSERQKVLQESKSLITSLESHRVVSPYAGWFASIEKEGPLPSVWKQTMIVLLVLFPIVMLELKFLPLITGALNPSLSTFIGNAISVTLIAWPMMPIAIWLLRWWLLPKEQSHNTEIFGFCVVTCLYILEIVMFWNMM